MLYGSPYVQVSAEFVKTISTTVEAGKRYYSAFSPLYTGYSVFKYADEIIGSPPGNLTAMGNFALTILSLPIVQNEMARTIEASLGIDHDLMQNYIGSAVTCLNIAATVLPMVSSYLSTTENKENLEKIKVAVDKIDQSLKTQQAPKIEQDSKEKANPQKRKNVLSQYPAQRKQKSHHTHAGKSKHRNRNRHPKKH